jgi:hypothetical protein
MPDKILNSVFAAVNPGNTMNVKIANAPKPTKIGVDVFFENTFLKSSFIFFGLVVYYVWLGSKLQLKKS